MIALFIFLPPSLLSSPPQPPTAASPLQKEPSLESTAVALLQAKQQLPSRRSLRRTRSSTYSVSDATFYAFYDAIYTGYKQFRNLGSIVYCEYSFYYV